MLTIVGYDESASAKSPSATVYTASTLYAATEGMIILEDSTDEVISGTFLFEAANPDNPDDTVSVTGAFTDLPLDNQ
jgi:hypothetical protein